MIIPEWLFRLVSAILGLAGVCAVFRLVKGPSLPDRLIAYDVIVMVGIGVMALTAIQTENLFFLDIILVWSIIAFLTTIAFARHLERKVKK